MNGMRLVKIMAVLILSTGFLAAFSQLGVLAVDKYLMPDGAFADDTIIGGVDVSGKTADQAVMDLAAKVDEWVSNASLQVELEGASHPIDASLLTFDIGKSVDEAQDGQSNALVADLTDADLETMVFSAYPGIDQTLFNTGAIKAFILENAMNIQTPATGVLRMEKFLDEASGTDIVSEVEWGGVDVTPGVDAAVLALSEVEVASKGQFSFLKQLRENGIEDITSEELSLVASLLYELFLKTNFAIMERNQGSELPEHVDLGLEAKVDLSSNQDLIFANPNEFPYTMTMERTETGIRARLQGIKFIYRYRYVLENPRAFPPKVIVQYHPTVNEGEVKVVEQGAKGFMVTVIRQRYDELGNILDSEWITEDFYPPIHRVEVRGLINRERPGMDEDRPSDNQDIIVLPGTGNPGGGTIIIPDTGFPPGIPSIQIPGYPGQPPAEGPDVDGTDTLPSGTSGDEVGEGTDPTGEGDQVWTDPGEITK